jgi:hypothetical protein
MKRIIAKIKRNYALLRAFFPTTLPQGMTEFNEFADSIIDLYDFPKDNDGYINMIATMIQHFDRTVHATSKYNFSRLMRKAVANEVAYYVIQDLKLKKKKENEAKVVDGEVVANGSKEEQSVQDPTVS